jgi:hypothetical protein
MTDFDALVREYEQKRRAAEARVESGELSQADCDLCGEPLDEDIGEFVREDGCHLLCHAQCGIDANLPQA